MINRLYSLSGVSIVCLCLVAPALDAQVTSNCDFQSEYVFRGCFGGRDCIPALTYPKLWSASEALYLRDSDLVLGVYQNGVARAYPHRILWWHEVVNDTLGGEMFLVSFCPLTSTGLLFDSTLNGREHTFGISGLLYNNNLIMYDRSSVETLFPQMCYSGRVVDDAEFKLNGDQLTLLPVLETTWSAWRELYPNTTVLSEDTGYERNYSHYPYGDYRTNNDFLLFRLAKEDTSLPRKDIVLGVNLNGIERAYPFKAMGEKTVLNDDVGGTKIVVLFVEEAQLAVAYYRSVAGQELTFEKLVIEGEPGFLEKEFICFRDKETGTVWNIKGEAISGPLATVQTRLEQVPAYNSMWFAWGAFWDDPEIADIESLVTSVPDRSQSEVPGDFVLEQNHPNPFNAATQIRYRLSRRTLVSLNVYNVTGQLVQILGNGYQEAGDYSVIWEAGHLPSGLYVYSLRTNEGIFRRKATLVK